MAEFQSCVGYVNDALAIARTKRCNEIDDFIAGLSHNEAERVMSDAACKYLNARCDERVSLQVSKSKIRAPKNIMEAYDKVDGIYMDLEKGSHFPGGYKTREEAIKAAHNYIKKWDLKMNQEKITAIEQVR